MGQPVRLAEANSSSAFNPLRPGEIVLLDTIGELASVYCLAAVAFVGGSLIPAGGHNPLEPAQFAVPIVMGPHYVNFRAITDDLLAHDAIRIAAKEDLAGGVNWSCCGTGHECRPGDGRSGRGRSLSSRPGRPGDAWMR